MKWLVIALLIAEASPLPAQGIPDTGNSKLWEMRKKMQQRSTQRAGTYLEQMEQALQSGDTATAESALKAAIAQGTLTQTQITDARDRIGAMVTQQQQAMVAEALAKEEAEMRRQASSAVSAGAAQMGAANTPKGAKNCSIEFKGGSLNAVRLFNVDAAGRETRLPSAASPGDCHFAKESMARDTNTSRLMVNVFTGDQGLGGTYGYELTFLEVLETPVFGARKLGHRQTFTGTFQIPAGAAMGTLNIKSFKWGAANMEFETPGWSMAR